MTDSPEPDTSTRRTEVSWFSKAAIQNPRCRINFVIYIYICTCNRYHGEDSVHLLPLTINFSRTRFLPPFFFMVEGARFTMHSSRCIPV